MALSKEKKKGCFYTEISPCLILGEKGCKVVSFVTLDFFIAFSEIVR